MILREKEDHKYDNGVWVCTTQEYHESLRHDLPIMQSLKLFGGDGPTGWQNLPSAHIDFEEQAYKACELIEKGDPRIGKIPKTRKSKAKKIRSK